MIIAKSQLRKLIKEEHALVLSLQEEEERAPYEEVEEAMWAFFEREGFKAAADEEAKAREVEKYGWNWEEYMQRSIEELEAHERRIATILGIKNEGNIITEVQDPIQAALDELINLLNQTSNGDYRSQIENIIRILNPDVGGTAQPYQLQPVRF